MIHKDVSRVLLPAGLISAAASVFGFIALFAPELLGWPRSISLLIKLGSALLAGMPLLWFVSFRSHRKSLWVYRNTKPVKMDLRIKVENDGESTSYVALLFSAGQSGVPLKVPVFPPGWKGRFEDISMPAEVFFDPGSKKARVIQVAKGRLWSMAP